LVVKYLDVIKQNIVWENIKNLSENNIYNSLRMNKRDSLLVKSGGEAYYEKIPDIKVFDKNDFITLSSEYKKGYLMHGPVGPSAACAIYNKKNFVIYSHACNFVINLCGIILVCLCNHLIGLNFRRSGAKLGILGFGLGRRHVGGGVSNNFLDTHVKDLLRT